MGKKNNDGLRVELYELPYKAHKGKEAVFRYNMRKMSEGERFAMVFCRSIGVVRYEQVRVAM